MHCHETLKVQLQLLLNLLECPEWTRNCTEVGEMFESNWGRDWEHKLPEGFVSTQARLRAALGQLVAHNDVDDASLARALQAASCWCARGGAVGRFLNDPRDRDGRVITITAAVASLFEDMAPIACTVESMLKNATYCPQNVALRVLLAGLNATPTVARRKYLMRWYSREYT